VLNDLQRLSGLGDLPLSYSYEDAALKVHFPGCDAQSVEALCDELGVQRGVLHQDEEFDAFVGTEIALLFPFAPSEAPSECEFYERVSVHGRQFAQPPIEWQEMMDEDVDEESEGSARTASDPYSTLSEDGLAYEDLAEMNPWEEDSPYGRSPYATSASPSGYGSFQALSEAALEEEERDRRHTPLEYQGIEGIYRFMEQCESRASR